MLMKIIEALRILGPFELVQGDTLKRTSPHANLSLNSNATWAVSNGHCGGAKVRDAIKIINDYLEETKNERFK